LPSVFVINPDNTFFPSFDHFLTFAFACSTFPTSLPVDFISAFRVAALIG